MKIKRIDETRTAAFEEFMEEKGWTLVIVRRNTGIFVTLEGDIYHENPNILPLGFERPTEIQAIAALKNAMYTDGYFD